MNAQETLRRSNGARVAATVSARTPALVKSVLDRMRPSDRTVAAKILATRAVERCAASAAADDWTLLSAWADRTCDRYAGVLAAPELIVAALDGVSRTLESAAAGHAGGGFRLARAHVDAIVGRPRAVAGSTQQEAVDEIDVVLDGLLSQLDQRDVLSAEHSRAVSSWCSRLAKRLGASKDDIVHLGRAGLVHDIGKVMTPPEILSAPRSLDVDEMAVMRLHAEVGAAIVADIPLVAHLVPGVRSHHERFDGAGYPDGLRGDAIPHVASVIAVADSFNAMIGRRPYRPALAPSVALERLVAGRGSQFHPDIVDAMIDVVTHRA